MLFINEIESMESLKRPRLKRLENAGTCDCLETFCMFMTRHTVKLPFVFLRCYCPRYHHENTLGSPKSWPRPTFFLKHWVWHICVHRKSSNCWSTFFFYQFTSFFLRVRHAWRKGLQFGQFVLMDCCYMISGIFLLPYILVLSL